VDYTLSVLCKKWASILGVSNWDIKIRYAEKEELSPGVNGNVMYVIAQEQALIRIKRMEDRETLEGFDSDEEESVVHELLHLVFAHQMPRSGLEECVFDQAIDRMARLLVKLKRT